MVQRCRVAVWRSWGSACRRRSANIGLSKGWSSSQTGHDYEDEQSHGTILTRRKWAKAPMQQAGQRGTEEKAGHMRTANKFHPKASAHAATVLPRFGKCLSVSIGCGENYETQGQRRYLLDIARVRNVAIHRHVPSFAGFRQIGRHRHRRQTGCCVSSCMNACRNFGPNVDARFKIAADGSGSSTLAARI